jgi:hypothetical protein
MSKVIFDTSISLDGFMTAANPRPREPIATAPTPTSEQPRRLPAWRGTRQEREGGAAR